MKTLLRHRLLSWTALVLLVAAVAYSCKDYLTVPSQGTLDEVTLATKAGVEGTLIAAYRALDCTTSTSANWGCAASNWVWGSVTADDSYEGSQATDQPPIRDIELYNWGTGNAETYFNTKWVQVYEGVVRTNATLRLLKKVLAEHPGEISPSDANGIKGEALFLRAHYHFEAWRMWKNVPYYTEDDQNYFKPNTGVDPIPLILADLNAAIALLPAAPRNGEVGRVTLWTATAYKGRVQVHSGDYAGGLTTLRAVQASNMYALEPDFHRVWTGVHAFANGPETILAYEASANDGEPNGNNSNYGERLNFPNGIGFCCGFNQPSLNLVNFFVVDDSGLPYPLTHANWNVAGVAPWSPDTNLSAGVSAVIPVDPRLDWTVGRDGVPYKDWGNHNPTFIRDRPYSGPYSPKKNVHEKSSGAQSAVGWLPAQLNSVHIHLYRYADLLLELAEAEVEAGAPDNARIIVNQIRARAGKVAQGPGTGAADIAVNMVAVTPGPATPLDTLNEPWARYRIGLYTTPWTQAFARTAVRIERRLELAMEGQRFFDLRRWNVADTAINNYVAIEKTRRLYKASSATFTSRHSLFPLPAIQIQLSRVGGQNTLQQNPGW